MSLDELAKAARHEGRGKMGDSEDIRGVFSQLLESLTAETRKTYGDNLTSLVVFGSVGRGTPTRDSDIDLLVVAKALPDGRMARVNQFEPVEAGMSQAIEQAVSRGIHARLSPLFRAEAEMMFGGLIFLDMTRDAKILVDKDQFFEGYINHLTERLKRLNAVRVQTGNTWYWVLKPDLKPGEVFEI